MNLQQGSGVKVWLGFLTVWLGILSAGVVGILVLNWIDRAGPAPDLMTRWRGDSLEISGSDGRWMVTHLEDLQNKTIAKLPEPLFVVESGGVQIGAKELATLKWNLPVDFSEPAFAPRTNYPPPTPATPVRALYFSATRSRFLP